MFLVGSVDLNPNCMRRESGTMSLLTRDVASVLKVVFRRLGHEVNVFIDPDSPTRAFSDAGDHLELGEIKTIVNVVFAVFVQTYDVFDTIKRLEELDIIPPADMQLSFWEESLDTKGPTEEDDETHVYGG